MKIINHSASQTDLLKFNGREKSRKAFTLVELIVVITILAILGTIAFISIQSYTVYARDAVRTSDLGSISRAITIKITEGGYAPKPESSVEITSSGTLVMYQGEFTQKMGSSYGVNGDLKDPLDGKNYTYSADANLFKHELAGFLESDELTFSNNSNGILTLSPKAQALEGRTIFTKGDKLGIIFSPEEVPVHELSLSGSTLDIVNTTDTYKVYFDNNETIEGTGSTLSVVNPRASCKRILEMGLVRKGDKADGVYKISPAGEEFEVYCDMTTDGGGWTKRTHFIPSELSVGEIFLYPNGGNIVFSYDNQVLGMSLLAGGNHGRFNQTFNFLNTPSREVMLNYELLSFGDNKWNNYISTKEEFLGNGLFICDEQTYTYGSSGYYNPYPWTNPTVQNNTAGEYTEFSDILLDNKKTDNYYVCFFGNGWDGTNGYTKTPGYKYIDVYFR